MRGWEGVTGAAQQTVGPQATVTHLSPALGLKHPSVVGSSGAHPAYRSCLGLFHDLQAQHEPGNARGRGGMPGHTVLTITQNRQADNWNNNIPACTCGLSSPTEELCPSACRFGHFAPGCTGQPAARGAGSLQSRDGSPEVAKRQPSDATWSAAGKRSKRPPTCFPRVV
jgi:hypothetical protein